MQKLYDTWHEHGALGVWDSLYPRLPELNWPIFLLAILVPLLLIYARNEIRVRRLRRISDFIASYPTTKQRCAPGQTGADEGVDTNPSLEFVTFKYTSDLRSQGGPDEIAEAAAHLGDPADSTKPSANKIIVEIEKLIRRSRIFGNSGDYRLFISSIGFIIVCYYGFSHLYTVISHGLALGCPDAVNCKTGCSPISAFAQLEIVGSLAFAGAFIAAMRQFVRSLAVFDLSAYTLLWQTAEIIASVLIVLFLFRAFEDPGFVVTAVLTGGPSGDDCSKIHWAWMALAPLLGLVPQSATKFLLVKMQSITSWIKLDDDRFSTVTRLTPLDVIDGIDYTTRFRLEECGIYDIQNLATYNPILLHIESPYGIYQTVDWVGQAQLCNVVGLDKFLLLRQMNVRTVFDLERALDFKSKTADGVEVDSPDQFDKIYAGIIFAATDAMRTVARISGTVPFTIDYAAPAAPAAPAQPIQGAVPVQPPQPAAPAQPAQGAVPVQPPQPAAPVQQPQPADPQAQPAPVDAPQVPPVEQKPVASQPDIAGAGIDAYCKWALKVIVADPATTKICMEHMMGWIADDLHVRRLRRIWQEMSDDLGPRAIRLDAPRLPLKAD